MLILTEVTVTLIGDIVTLTGVTVTLTGVVLTITGSYIGYTIGMRLAELIELDI